MLIANVISSDTTLNRFDVINSLEYISGEQVTLFIQLIQPQRKDKLRYMTPSTAILTCHFQNKDGSVTDLALTVLPGDSSVWSGTLTAAMTAALSPGNFAFTLDPSGTGTPLIQGWVQNGLSLVITGNC